MKRSADYGVDCRQWARASIAAHAGRVRLHRRGAPSWDAAECTLGPGFDLPAAPARRLLPSAFSGGAYDFASEWRLSFTQHLSIGVLPNQAPEPTTTAVTPRAIESIFDMKQWNLNRNVARVAPAVVVAHL